MGRSLFVLDPLSVRAGDFFCGMSQLFVYKTRLFWYTEKGNAGKVLSAGAEGIQQKEAARTSGWGEE